MGAVKSITHSYSYREYLFWYIEKNDIPNIELVLQKRPDLLNNSLTVNFKTTPLHRASVNGKLQIVKLLVQKYQADIDFMTQNGQTPLMGAAKRDKLQIASYLLIMNANADAVSGCGLKPVQYAILAGFYEMALMIYEKMKEKDLKDYSEYEELGNKFQYRYVNYKLFLESLVLRIDPENVPGFLVKPKKIYEDPVVDPRQTWKNWFWRNLDFKDPPLCERTELPDELQPQNRRFGKINYFFSKMAMTHMSQKPSFYPQSQSQSASNDKIHVKNRSLQQKHQQDQVRSAI